MILTKQTKQIFFDINDRNAFYAIYNIQEYLLNLTDDNIDYMYGLTMIIEKYVHEMSLNNFENNIYLEKAIKNLYQYFSVLFYISNNKNKIELQEYLNNIKKLSNHFKLKIDNFIS